MLTLVVALKVLHRLRDVHAAEAKAHAAAVAARAKAVGLEAEHERAETEAKVWGQRKQRGGEGKCAETGAWPMDREAHGIN